MERICRLITLDDTKRLGAVLATALQSTDTITLQGDLGVGKTELARAIIQSLTQSTEVVPSPTFTLVQTYDTPKGVLWHFDLYRLKTPEEAYELGIDEALADGIALIEWPKKLGDRSYQNHLDVHLSLDSLTQERQCVLKGSGHWQEFLKTEEVLWR